MRKMTELIKILIFFYSHQGLYVISNQDIHFLALGIELITLNMFWLSPNSVLQKINFVLFPYIFIYTGGHFS